MVDAKRCFDVDAFRSTVEHHRAKIRCQLKSSGEPIRIKILFNYRIALYPVISPLEQDLGIWNHLGVVVNWLLGAYGNP